MKKDSEPQFMYVKRPIWDIEIEEHFCGNDGHSHTSVLTSPDFYKPYLGLRSWGQIKCMCRVSQAAEAVEMYLGSVCEYGVRIYCKLHFEVNALIIGEDMDQLK